MLRPFEETREETPRLNSKILYKCIRSNEGFAKGQRQTLISLRKDRAEFQPETDACFFPLYYRGESGTPPSLPPIVIISRLHLHFNDTRNPLAKHPGSF